jgi:RNA polymerase sigma factor (sigma-70 family)
VSGLAKKPFEGNSEGEFVNFIKEIVKNKALSELRKERIRSMVSAGRLEDLDQLVEQFVGLKSTASQYQWHNINIIKNLFASIGSICKELLPYFDGVLSYAAIAERLGVPEGTVKSRLKRCKEKVISVLKVLLKTQNPRECIEE